MACVSALMAGAQSPLTLQFADTADCSKTAIYLGNRKGLSKFDAVPLKFHVATDGKVVVDSAILHDMDFCPAWLYVGEDAFPFIYEPGKRLELSVSRNSDGSAKVDYKGDNVAESKYFSLYENLFDYDRYFIYPPENDTISVEVKRGMLEDNYKTASKELKRFPKGEIRDFLDTLTQDAYLGYNIRFCGGDKEKSAELMKKVDLNSWIGLYNYLPLWAFESELSEPDFDADMTPWGLEYIEAIKKKITDPAVRESLLGHCAEAVISWGKCDNIDDFWTPFVEFAGKDSRAVRRYADRVISIKKNKSGMPAIDFSFKDRDGNSHRLSDYFGKVLYIDCWASWCGPCRKEIPHIEKHYKEYYKGNDKIAFISISIDEDRDAWLRLIEKDKPEWLQFIASGEESEALSKAYGIMGIPRFLLFNADGTIADADAFRPSDENFRQKLDEVINRK